MTMMPWIDAEPFVIGWSCLTARLAGAQDNYEIQVYSYDTVQPGHTMVELHNNFTVQGSKTTEDGVRPTNHQWHETIEITHGFTQWFEVGFYLFYRRAKWTWMGLGGRSHDRDFA